MDPNTQTRSISRRGLLNRAAVVAAGTGLTALTTQPAYAATTPAGNDNRPRLPLRILVRGGLSDAATKQIQELSPQITLVAGSERFADELAAADVVFGKLTPAEVATAKRLRWLQVTSVGVDSVLTPEFVASEILLTNTRGCSGAPIAEHAWAFLLALTRGVGLAAHQRKWEGWSAQQVELRGMTMGIIGLGSIGREVARRAKAMDMHVIAVDAEPMYHERFAMVDELWLVDTGLDEMLSRSDVLVCCAPLTTRTEGMLGAGQFAQLKTGAYFVNVTRGKVVQTDALLAAIKDKKLAGAGLDVTDPEPLPPDHPLWNEPNVIITPHKAGRSQLSGKRENDLFVENVRRYVAGLPLLNVVDKQKGY